MYVVLCSCGVRRALQRCVVMDPSPGSESPTEPQPNPARWWQGMGMPSMTEDFGKFVG